MRKKIAGINSQLLLIQTTNNEVFGTFLDQPFEVNSFADVFFGTGACFMFAYLPPKWKGLQRTWKELSEGSPSTKNNSDEFQAKTQNNDEEVSPQNIHEHTDEKTKDTFQIIDQRLSIKTTAIIGSEDKSSAGNSECLTLHVFKSTEMNDFYAYADSDGFGYGSE